MISYHANFSVELPLPNDAAEAEEWVKGFNSDKLAATEEAFSMGDPSLQSEFEERFSGVAIRVSDDSVVVESEDDFGNVDAAEMLISSYLQHFGMDHKIFLSWVEYCSKLRPGDFGGGASIINRIGVVKTVTTRDLWQGNEVIDLLN